MNIVIIGAGEVGRSIAGTLANEEHNVYLVEQNEDNARNAEEELGARRVRHGRLQRRLRERPKMAQERRC